MEGHLSTFLTFWKVTPELPKTLSMPVVQLLETRADSRCLPGWREDVEACNLTGQLDDHCCDGDFEWPQGLC